MTIRLDAPNPLTEAFVAMVLSLAFIQNIRTTGISCPARRLTSCNFGISCGAFVASGSYLLNSGSMTYGHANIINNRSGRDDPEIQPPALCAPANDRVQQPHQQTSEEEDQQQRLSPIAEPRAPRLDRNAVAQQNPLPEQVQR